MTLTKEQIIDWQRRLQAAGFNPGPIDGVWGPKTEAANKLYENAEATHNPPTANAGSVQLDSRSEKNIASLLPKAQAEARRFLAAIIAAGIEARIISGNRTWAEQDALYDQGRTKPGKVVTNAPGGYSNHNFGIAWDIGIFEGGKYVEESPKYAQAGIIAKEMDLEWGGDWHSIRDEPHFQIRTSFTVSELRDRYLRGLPYV